MIKNISHIIKYILIVIWISLILFWASIFIFHPEYLTAQNIKVFFDRFGEYMIFTYLIISIFRGFTLIPSTPFVLAGLLLFPDNLILVYIISLTGILLSAAMIYFFSREMGFEEILLKKHKKLILKSEFYTQKYGFFAVTLWSFLIIVPTDLICYVAWTLKMNFWKFIWGVFIWEWIICWILIYGWWNLIQL